MATYPSVVGSLNNPNASDRLNNPSHSALHQSENSEIVAIETFVGTLSSTQGTLMYDVRAAASNGGGHVQTAVKGGTGQTSFNKGDILVASSSSVLTKLASGADGLVLVANSSVATGVTWGSASKPNVRIYTPSSVTSGGAASFLGIWYKPSIMTYAVIEVTGGGGGGGGTTTADIGCAGGGAGGYGRITVAASLLPLAASIICGTGGGGGAGTGGDGAAGGPSWFGSVLSATGGTGSSGTNSRDPGQGGIAASGDLNVGGNPGTSGINATGFTQGGNGGSNPLGGGGAGGPSGGGGGVQTGGAGFGYGGGGGGAQSDNGNDSAGGRGTDGVLIIYEY